MSNTNRRKAEQLGMPIGTASGRLKKKIMLMLLQKLGEDICFRCGQRIETAEELSVEHKQPWLYVSPDLFWDLDNVAFSHRACNRPDRPNGGTAKSKTSRYRGVMWEEKRSKGRQGKWRACIWHQGKTVHIGYFDDEETAAQAYDREATILKGEKAWLNFR